MNSFPRQRLSFFQKSKDDYKWAKDSIDYIVSQHLISPYGNTPYSIDYARMKANYLLYNNVVDQKDFERECNPFGLEVGQFKDTVLPYNKAYNKIQVLLGDELHRPFSYKAVLTNSDGVRSKLAHRDYLLRQWIYSRIQESVSQLKALDKNMTDEDISNILPPDQIDTMMKTSYLDAREILSNKILNYLEKKLSIKQLKNDAFKHALISGYEFVYVGEHNGQPHMEILNPLGMFFHKSPETKFIQDGLYAGYRTYMTPGEILDRYSQYLTEEQIRHIDSTNEGRYGIRDDVIAPDMRYYHETYPQHLSQYTHYSDFEGSYSQPTLEDHLVYHVEWRSQRKVGFLTFTNEFGDSQTEMVSEDFEIPTPHRTISYVAEYNAKHTAHQWEDINSNVYSLEWKWIPEIWTGTRIAADMYVMVGPKVYQYRSQEDPYDVKLGYHGLSLSSMNAPSVAMMDRMKPYVYLFFIVMHKLKKFIAQDQGKIFHFDSSMVDPTIGLEKTLYYLKELNIDFYNSLENADMPGQSQRGKIHQTSDWSNMQHILNYVQLLDAIDYQISDVAGVNKAREGQVSPGEAVTNAQSNLSMSTLITEILFQHHQDLWESILDCLLKVSLRCFKGQKLATQYVLDDMSISALELTTDSLDNAEVGIFVSNASKEIKLYSTLESMAEALIRANKATFSDLIKAYKAVSVEDLEKQITASEERALRNEQEVQNRQIEGQLQLQKNQQEFESLKQDKELQVKLEIAKIQSFARQQDQDINSNQIPDQLEVAKFEADVALKSRELDIKEKEVKVKEKVASKPPSSK